MNIELVSEWSSGQYLGMIVMVVLLFAWLAFDLKENDGDDDE
tara:strand:- start:270 stop:395 length:126 start_codon:yes stop_codon:yes gene_type:complete